MIRHNYSTMLNAGSLPRMRGDDPVFGVILVPVRLFAPHARG